MSASKKWVLALLATSAVACGDASSDVAGSDTSNITQGERASAPEGADKVTRAHGTEPFWGLTIDATTVKFELAGDSTMTIDNRGAKPAEGVTAEYAVLYQGRTRENPDRFLNVMITRSEGGCSDGMSDEIYPYTVSVLSGNSFFTGCGGKPSSTDVPAADVHGAGADKVTQSHGTEPFWGVTITPASVKFELAGGESPMTIDNRGPTAAHGVTLAHAVVYQGRTKEDPNRFLNVLITAEMGGCSDGMSDEIYPYTVSVLSGTTFLTGCGR